MHTTCLVVVSFSRQHSHDLPAGLVQSPACTRLACWSRSVTSMHTTCLLVSFSHKHAHDLPVGLVQSSARLACWFCSVTRMHTTCLLVSFSRQHVHDLPAGLVQSPARTRLACWSRSVASTHTTCLLVSFSRQHAYDLPAGLVHFGGRDRPLAVALFDAQLDVVKAAHGDRAQALDYNTNIRRPLPLSHALSDTMYISYCTRTLCLRHVCILTSP